MPNLRVSTWNIFGVNFLDSSKRYPYIKKAVEEYDPDIALFQEVIFPWDNSFVEGIGDYHAATLKKVRSSGLAAATKQKPKSVNYTVFNDQAGIFNLKQLSDKFLRKGWQELDLEDITIINTHLACSYSPDDQANSTIESQAEQLLQSVRQMRSEGKKIILAGDLNFRKHSPLYDAFTAELTDLTADLPVEDGKYKKVDFIFSNCGELVDSGYVGDPSMRNAYSDHHGIQVNLQI